MKTLFIDTHSELLVIALFENERIITLKELTEQKNHSTICMNIIKDTLDENNIKIKEIANIIVVIGPGSFTGVRIGVTIAKIFAFSLKIPIRTLTSLELFLPQKESQKYLAIKEKNGYFLGKLNNEGDQILEYKYLKKEEFITLKEQSKIIMTTTINYEKVIQTSLKKEPLNPHLVNPFYVKTIEVEK